MDIFSRFVEMLKAQQYIPDFTYDHRIEINPPPRIKIPAGEFAAPTDYQIQPTILDFGNRRVQMDLVCQTQSGNCTVYTALNAAILCNALKLSINPYVLAYLGYPDYDSIESELAIPIILGTIPANYNIEIRKLEYENLEEKMSNSMFPLSTGLSALLFRAMVSPNEPFRANDEVDGALTGANLRQLHQLESSAVYVGHAGHATCFVVKNGICYYIDPTAKDILSIVNKEDMKRYLREIALDNGFYTINPLR